jgi:hypothetical protein
MSQPANTYGNGVITVDASRLSVAPAIGTSKLVDVVLGRPMGEALPNILNVFQIRVESQYKTGANLGRPAYLLEDAGLTNYDMALSFAQQGVQEGHTVYLEDA